MTDRFHKLGYESVSGSKIRVLDEKFSKNWSHKGSTTGSLLADDSPVFQKYSINRFEKNFLLFFFFLNNIDKSMFENYCWVHAHRT